MNADDELRYDEMKKMVTGTYVNLLKIKKEQKKNDNKELNRQLAEARLNVAIFDPGLPEKLEKIFLKEPEYSL